MVGPEVSGEQVSTAPARKRGRFAGDVFKLVGGTTIAQAITVLTAPVISRLFAPEVFGTWSVFVSLVGIVSVIVCLRYQLAILLPERDEEAANVLGVAIGAAVVVSALSAVVLAVAGGPLVQWIRAPDLAPFLWLVPVALLIQGFFQGVNYWNSRARRFGRLSVARVAASATTSALPMGLGSLGYNTVAVLIGTWVAGTVVNVATLAGQVWRDLRRLLGSIRPSRMLEALKRYRKFPLIDSWGGFINNLSWQLPSLMLSGFFSAAVVGFYSQGYRVITLPLSLIGDAIGQVFFQRASAARARGEALQGITQAVFRQLVALGLFPALVLTVAGQELFTIVLGSAWTEAGLYAQILSPWVFALTISSPLSTIFLVLERQELALIVHTSILVTRFVSLLVGGLVGNVYLALALWSGSGALVYGGLAIWNLALARVSLSGALGALLRYALYSLPAVALLAGLKFGLHAAPWVILVVTVVAAGLYYLLVLRRDRELLGYLLSLLRRK